MKEVEEFEYLEFTCEKNEGYRKHSKELINKGKCASKTVW